MKNVLPETKFKALPYLLKWNKTFFNTRLTGKRWLLADLIEDLAQQESLAFLDKQSFHLFLQALLKHDHQLSVYPSKNVPFLWEDIQTIIKKNKESLLPLDCALLESSIRKSQYDVSMSIEKDGLEALLPYMDTSDSKPYSAIRELFNSGQTVSFCMSSKDKLDLMIYLIKTNKRADGHYKRAYQLFGDYYADFGYSAKEKKAAVNALQEVVFHEAAIETLEPHKHALTNGELGQIFRRFYPEEYKEWRSWHTDLKMVIHHSVNTST